ncbi:hypothetical protein PCASD_06156 [Puccinia coronata f. sp. avenae]|uniref:Uncharacterized protein n=1 Tax=Puccinia coronata f. sp. avenae TaxID=200324 RepID=A0A2N5UZY3_9BASI|nr:hypothetical protein PCASD_06156 [Puccinia coronata f. sp. avenae]
MRWAINQHQQLQKIINAFDEPNPRDCDQLAVLINHPILQSLDHFARILAAESVIHPAYMKLTNNQVLWNDFCNQLVRNTTSQLDNHEVCAAWSVQMN